MRISPAEVVSEYADVLAKETWNSMRAPDSLFENCRRFLKSCRGAGADLIHVRGFHDGELLGVEGNVQNRGDYCPAQNLGGLEALRGGIHTAKRAGGHVLLYVEGFIVWKRGRIGRSIAKEWQIRNRDGSPVEHYRGFWHACPACTGYQDWLAKTLAETIRITGADGFFIDSSLATTIVAAFIQATPILIRTSGIGAYAACCDAYERRSTKWTRALFCS